MRHLTKISSVKWDLLFLGAFVANIINSAATDIFFVLLVLFAIFAVLRTKSIKPFTPLNALNVLILIWVFANIVGYIFLSMPLTREQTEEILGLRWVISVYGCIYAGSKIKLNESWLSYTFIFLASLVAFAMLQHLNFDAHRFFGFYKNPNVFAMALLIPLAFVTGFVATPSANVQIKALNFIVLLILACALFFTYTRGAWIAAASAFFVAALINKNKKYIYASLIMALCCIVMFYFNILNFADRLAYSFDLSSGSSQSLRLIVWKVSWQVFLDHPWFGVGFYESYRLFPQYYHQMGLQNNMILTHSHNQYLQVLVSSGIVGFLVYLIFFAITLRYFYRVFTRNRNNIQGKVALGAFLTIIVFMVSSLFDSPLMISEPRGFLILVLGGSYGFLRGFFSQKTV